MIRAAVLGAVSLAAAVVYAFLPSHAAAQGSPPPAPAPAEPPPVVAPAATPTPAALVPWGGAWKPQSCEYDGQQQLTGPSKDAIRASINGTEHRLYYITDPKENMGRRLATADLTADAKAGTFEMTIKDGYRKGEKVHGIYKIEGDSLRLCYGPAGKPRPKEFAAPKGSEVFNETWVRANSK